MPKHSRLLYKFRGYILGAMAMLLIAMPPHPLNSPNLQEYYSIAAFYLIVGILLRIRTRQYIGNHTRGKEHQAQSLVTQGPYRIIRHPLYLSNLIIAYGFILFHLGATLLCLPFLIAAILFEMALYRMEDEFLHEKFGQPWELWKKETGALIPKISILARRRKEHQSPPSQGFIQAFCADWSTWFWLSIFILILFLRKVYSFS